MNAIEHNPIEDTLQHAEHRHPVDFLEPLPSGDESIRRTCEVLSRTFMWVADAGDLEQIGLRATVVLYCVRADLIGGATLEDIGFQAGCTRQAVENLVVDFTKTIGWK
jgi:hypothetical protein